MNIVKVTKEEALIHGQTKKFGVVQNGHNGIWGEDNNCAMAVHDAEHNMMNGCGKSDFDDCYVMEIV